MDPSGQFLQLPGGRSKAQSVSHESSVERKSSTSRGRSRSWHKPSPKKRSSRSLDLHRKDRRHQLMSFKRGISPSSYSDENIEQENTDPKVFPKEQSFELNKKRLKQSNELMKRLEEYRQKKMMKKMEELKKKKPPFKVGTYKLEREKYPLCVTDSVKSSSKQSNDKAVCHNKKLQLPKPKLAKNLELVATRRALPAAQTRHQKEKQKDALDPQPLKSRPKQDHHTSRKPGKCFKGAAGTLHEKKEKKISCSSVDSKVGSDSQTESKAIVIPTIIVCESDNGSNHLPTGVSGSKSIVMNNTYNLADRNSDSLTMTSNVKNFQQDVKAENVWDSAELEQRNVRDTAFFRDSLRCETDYLKQQCNTWSDKLNDSNLSEDSQGKIRSAIGLARLGMESKGRFNQFEKLIDDCEFKRGVKVTTCQDLQGFWDMILIQIEDTKSKFRELEKLEADGWVHPKEEVLKKKCKLRIVKLVKPSPKPSFNLRKTIMKNRRLLQNKANVNSLSTKQNDDSEKCFDGGFFEVKTPLKKNIKPALSSTPNLECESMRRVNLPKEKDLSFCTPSSTKRPFNKRLSELIMLSTYRLRKSDNFGVPENRSKKSQLANDTENGYSQGESDVLKNVEFENGKNCLVPEKRDWKRVFDDSEDVTPFRIDFKPLKTVIGPSFATPKNLTRRVMIDISNSIDSDKKQAKGQRLDFLRSEIYNDNPEVVPSPIKTGKSKRKNRSAKQTNLENLCSSPSHDSPSTPRRSLRISSRL